MKVYEEDYTRPGKVPKRLNAGGPLQSMIFTMEALRQLEFFGLKWARFGRAEVHDYGCAEGFGTALLACEFPLNHTVGFDINPEFIDHAKTNFPTLDWKIGDIQHPQKDADIIWTSHTIEHVERPDLAALKLVEHSRILTIIILPPIGPEEVTHRGAMLTDEFIRAIDNTILKDHLLLTTRYETVRAHRPTNSIYHEHNIMLVFRGLAS